ncbi:MAG: trypsin-like peptidase domain-containing protein [Leptospiraceae bacterium]|nr:trypsin-like peptidase domain-containing protein [Leptospiraceae bacterium]
MYHQIPKILIRILGMLSIAFFTLITNPIRPESIEDFDTIRKSVVQIKVFSQSADPYSPWNPGSLSASGGTGFLIDGNRILTNAHVVSNAKYIQIQRYNQTEWYEARLNYIAHDCDLAILQAIKPIFYKDAEFLEFGGIPELNTPITIIGYPIGGSRISVSRGIVSRKEQSTYAHSQVDNHLVIQVDAAINPGNSGGPAIQNGKVAGVAFQVAAKGENIGYIIPTTVVNHFLKDIEDGVYDGYVELGIQFQNTFNSKLREYYKIPEETEGVLVNKVYSGGSAFGYLKPKDLLISLDGKKIARNGSINLDTDTRIDFVELIDNKFAGDSISFELIRDGKLEKIVFPAKKMPDFDFMRFSYDQNIDYVMFGGLIFQEVNRNLLSVWSRSSNTSGGSQLLYRFYNFISDQWNSKKKADVVLYRKLDHPVNTHTDHFLNLIIHRFDGKEIQSLDDLKLAIQNSKNRYVRLEFMDLDFPLILDREEIIKANPIIKKTYNMEQ